MNLILENLLGRLLLEKDISAFYNFTDQVNNENKLIKICAMTSVNANKVRCNRCGTIHIKTNVKLPIGAFFCPTCLELGRVRSDEYFYHLPQQDFSEKTYLRWTGKLTENQEKISNALCQQITNNQKRLVQAVTGAGKTEMINQLIEQILSHGGSVGLASPRIDVCIELHQRLSRDFTCQIPLLYHEGDSYFRSPLVVMTSHQLLRFKEAFDLLIIDEVDAFPFRDNDMLYFALENAKKINGNLLYLTATSTDKLDKQIKKA